MQTFTFNLLGKTYDRLSVRMKMESTTQQMSDELLKLLGHSFENKYRLMVGGMEIYPVDCWRRLTEYQECFVDKGFNINIILRLAGGGKRGHSSSTRAANTTRDQALRNLREEVNAAVAKTMTKKDVEPHVDVALQMINEYYEMVSKEPRETIRRTLDTFSYEDLRSLSESLACNKGLRYAPSIVDKYAFQKMHEGISAKRDAHTYLEECSLAVSKFAIANAYMVDSSDRISWTNMVDDVFGLVNAKGFAAGRGVAQG